MIGADLIEGSPAFGEDFVHADDSFMLAPAEIFLCGRFEAFKRRPALRNRDGEFREFLDGV